MEIRQVSSVSISSSQRSDRIQKSEEKEIVINQKASNSSEKSVQAGDLEKLVEGANKFFQLTTTHLHFQLHEELNKYYVQVKNSDTNEVIKEIPSKKFLDMVSKLQELAGLIVDEKI